MINIINLIKERLTFDDLLDIVLLVDYKLAQELISCVREGFHPQGHLIFYERDRTVYFHRMYCSGPRTYSLPEMACQADKEANKLREMLCRCYGINREKVR